MRRLNARDEGSMLVEMLVGMVLTGIVTTLVLQGIVGGFRSQRDLQNRGEGLAAVRAASERLARDIRGANPVLKATSTTLELRRYTTNGDTMRLVWQVVDSAGVLSLQKSAYTTPVGSTVEGAAVVSTVIDHLTSGVDPFTYGPVVNFTPASGTVNATTCAIASSTPTEYDRTCIGEVALHLSRDVVNHTPVVVDTTINLRNQT